MSRLSVILLGGFAKPLYRFHLILRQAFATVQADAQVVLSLGDILFGPFANPFHRLHLIFRDAFALFVAKTEFRLRLCVACFCFCPDFFKRSLIGLGLLRGQLNDNNTRRQQKREYQPARFHIGKLIGFQHAC